MKKSILAMAVLGVFSGAASAQSSVTIYGAIDASLSYTSKINTAAKETGSLVAMDAGLLKGNRLGVKGAEDLGGGLKALFTIENGFRVDTGDAAQGGLLWGRQAVVGLSGGFGSVLVGRQYDVINDVGGITSPGDFGGVVSRVHSLNLDRTNGERVNNSIRYNSPDFSGFSGSLIYGLGEKAGSSGAGQSFGVGGLYSNGPLNLGLAYFQSKMAEGKSSSDVNGANSCNGAGTPGDTCLKTWTLAAAYQFGPARVYGSYSQVKLPLAKAYKVGDQRLNTFDERFNPDTGAGFMYKDGATFSIGGPNNESSSTLDVGVNYKLMPNVSLISSVQYTRAKFVKATDGRLVQFNVGTRYDLSKRTTVYAVLRNLRASEMYNVGVTEQRAPGLDHSQTAVSAGMIHSF